MKTCEICDRPAHSEAERFCRFHTVADLPFNKTCEFPGCNRPADTVVDGRGFCGDPRHRNYRQEVPLRPCAISWCQYPVNGASEWCIHHASAAQRPGGV
jgi:hypothetical protein